MSASDCSIQLLSLFEDQVNAVLLISDSLQVHDIGHQK